MTLREHLEAIRDANLVGFGSVRTWARFNEEHAVAALEILKSGEKYKLTVDGVVHLPVRVVFDPERN